MSDLADVDPRLVETLADLADDYGAAGVLHTAMQMWPRSFEALGLSRFTVELSFVHTDPARRSYRSNAAYEVVAPTAQAAITAAEALHEGCDVRTHNVRRMSNNVKLVLAS